MSPIRPIGSSHCSRFAQQLVTLSMLAPGSPWAPHSFLEGELSFRWTQAYSAVPVRGFTFWQHTGWLSGIHQFAPHAFSRSSFLNSVQSPPGEGFGIIFICHGQLKTSDEIQLIQNLLISLKSEDPNGKLVIWNQSGISCLPVRQSELWPPKPKKESGLHPSQHYILLFGVLLQGHYVLKLISCHMFPYKGPGMKYCFSLCVV